MRAPSFALLIILSAASCAADADLPVTSTELSLGGVAIGDSEAAAESALAQVVRSEHPDNYLTIKLESAGLTVLIDPQEGVGEISSERPQHCTSTGVCPGMLFDDVPATLGRPSITNQDSSHFLAQYATTTDCWIELSVNAGRVESVRIACPV
jgi:hypothetical protein